MKKRILATLMAMAMMVSMVGCGNANANANANAGNSTPTDQTSGPAQGADSKTLTVAFASGGKTMNPTRATDSTSAIFINAAYDQLVTYGTTKNKDGFDLANTADVKSSLAKSWTQTDDGLEYTIKLDEKAKFANGDPVNADSVIYSFNRIKNSNYTGFLYSLANIDTMEKTDDYTIVFKLTKPCTIFFNLLQMHIFSIINPNQLAGKTEEEIDTFLATETVGSGAFKVEKWDATTESVLVARDDYWKGKAPLEKVVVKIIPEASNRILLAQKGDIDIAMTVPPKDLPTLEGNANVDVRVYDGVSIVYLSLNTLKAPLDNVKVRQALNYAIPYDSVINDVLSGKAAKLDHVIPSAMPGYIKEDTGVYKTDTEKAKQLLTEAGFPNGFEIKLLVSSGNQDQVDATILIQSELAKIGVKVAIEKMERAQYLEATRKHNFDMAVASYTSFVNDPGYFFGNCLYSKGEYNYGSYNSKEVDTLWEKAESSNDLQERYKIYQDAQLIVANDCPWVPLYENSTIMVMNKGISSYIHYPDGSLRFATMAK